MMKNLLFALICLFLLSSCSGPIDKPIFEKLSLDELKQITKNDTLFEETYKLVEYTKDSVLLKDIDRVKWSDLTYKRVHNIVELMMDTAFYANVKKVYGEEWDKKYKKYTNSADSLSNYWKQYKKDNSLDQYVSIELAKVNKEYYSYINELRDVNLGFRLTPLKGPVDQLEFSYLIRSKISSDSSYSPSVYSIMNKRRCLMSRPLTKERVLYWEANYSDRDIFSNRNLSSFLRDYNIFIEVDKVRVNGVNHSLDDLNIPKCIENHWEYENHNNEYLRDLYVDDIVKEFFYKDYVNRNSYILKGYSKDIKSKDSLASAFVELYLDKK